MAICFLKRSFSKEFISGLTYSFTYNELVDAKKMRQFYVNLNFDIAGKAISLFGK
jgi:outer membrane protein insertion porin family